MESVRKAKERMKKFPLLLAQCRVEGSAYAKCVAKYDDIAKDACKEEFIKFKNCLQKAAASMNTRI